MRQNAYQSYFEADVLGADPIQLVQILYQAALDSVRTARQCLRGGDIAGRSRAIAKALAISTELVSSLDHERGGDLSRKLLGLYDYIQRLLMDANFRQVDEPMAEAESLLTTLLEAWRGCRAKVNSETEQDSRRHGMVLTAGLETAFAHEMQSTGSVCYAG